MGPFHVFRDHVMSFKSILSSSFISNNYFKAKYGESSEIQKKIVSKLSDSFHYADDFKLEGCEKGSIYSPEYLVPKKEDVKESASILAYEEMNKIALELGLKRCQEMVLTIPKQ